jgi:signal transduction histidine kinase
VRLWLILIFSLLFSYLSLFTNTIISGTTARSWGNEVIYGTYNDYFNAFSIFAAFIIVYLFFRKFFASKKIEKDKIRLFFVGTLLLIIFNIVFNVIYPIYFKTAEFQNLGDYSSIFFIIIAAYTIVKDHFLGIKTFTTSFLISYIGMLLVIDILDLSHSALEQEIKIVILLCFIIISVLLVRSVLNEVHQKEELEKANLALKKSQQRYMDLASEQKDIIDVMGHEIRTPLTTIIQEIKIHQKYTLPIEDTLLKEAENQPNLHKLLPFLLDTIKITDSAATHALGIVTDMLETARLDKKRFELDLEQFDLVQLTKEAISLTEKGQFNENKHLNISLELPANIEEATLMVLADKTRIREAILALLSNALKYQDPQKEVLKIKVKLEPQKNGQSNPLVKLTIQDNGIGLNPEDIPKLGRKFFRVSSQKKSHLPRPGGTGLGLFVVQGIMEHHHGHMEILSPGKGLGSSFSLVFPQNQN